MEKKKRKELSSQRAATGRSILDNALPDVTVSKDMAISSPGRTAEDAAGGGHHGG
jgi:hypothetical protein